MLLTNTSKELCHLAELEPALTLARSDWQKRDAEQCAIAHDSEAMPNQVESGDFSWNIGSNVSRLPDSDICLERMEQDANNFGNRDAVPRRMLEFAS